MKFKSSFILLHPPKTLALQHITQRVRFSKKALNQPQTKRLCFSSLQTIFFRKTLLLLFFLIQPLFYKPVSCLAPLKLLLTQFGGIVKELEMGEWQLLLSPLSEWLHPIINILEIV